MSELPSELRRVLAEGRHGHEPALLRLQAVRARVLAGSAVQPEFDLAPPCPPVRRGWLLPGLAVLTIVVGVVVLWPAAPLPSTARPAATRMAGPIEPAAEAPIPSAREPVTPPRLPPRSQPGSAAPRASVQNARPVRESAPAPSSQDTKSAPSLRRAPPRVSAATAFTVAPEPAVEPAQVAIPQALASRSEAVSTSAREAAPGASLQDEVKWITRAQKALAHGDVATAEQALGAHQRAHPVGQLQAERVALMARARCLAHDLASARGLHAQLALLVPGSSLLRSVERACPELTR